MSSVQFGCYLFRSVFLKFGIWLSDWRNQRDFPTHSISSSISITLIHFCDRVDFVQLAKIEMPSHPYTGIEQLSYMASVCAHMILFLGDFLDFLRLSFSTCIQVFVIIIVALVIIVSVQLVINAIWFVRAVEEKN